MMLTGAAAVLLLGCESEETPGGDAPAAAPAPTAPQRTGAIDLSILTGLEGVSLQMPLEKVKARLPDATEVEAEEDLGAGTVPGSLIDRYVLRDRRVSGLPKPVTLELRFWKDKLWVVNVITGENGMPLVDSLLRARLGEREEGDALRPSWVGDGARVAASLKVGWYAVSDERLSEDARTWFAEILRGGMKMQAPSAATPSA